MKGVTKYILLLAVVISMSSCVSSMREKVSIERYENLQVMGFAGVKTDLVFRNESGRNIDVKAVTLHLKEKGAAIATLTLKEELEIPRRSEEVSIPTLWSLSNVNILTALSASKKILSGKDLENFKVDIDVEVKVSVVKKSYEFKDRSLADLMKSLSK